MIAVRCKCGNKMSAPDHYAGKRVKCAKCGAVMMLSSAGVVTVTAKVQDDSGPSLADLEREIESGAPPIRTLPPRDGDDEPPDPRLATPRPSLPVPDYWWLKQLGHFWIGIGIVTIVLGTAAALTTMIVGMMNENAASLLLAGATLLSALLSGALVVAVGQAILAFRDIARNSWRGVSPACGDY